MRYLKTIGVWGLVAGAALSLVVDHSSVFAALPAKVFVIDDGTYDINGSVNIQKVTKKFYATNPDDYDFLAVYTTFRSNNGADFSIVAQYDVVGIGYPSCCFNYATLYGSSGKLKSVSFVHNMDNIDGSGDLLHEVSHKWLMYITNSTQDPKLSISRDCCHWSQYVDTSTRRSDGVAYGSINGGNPWRDNGNGTFSLDMGVLSANQVDYARFHTAELYLMGLVPKWEVQPLDLIVHTAEPKPGDYFWTVPGYKKLITVDDLIRYVGRERIPTYPDTQRDFSIAFILLTHGQPATTTQIEKINSIAENFPKEWSALTGGRSSMNAANPHALLFHPTSSGFELTLDTLLDISTLNLYGTQTGGQGDSDVVVTGAVVGPVAGSLLVSADGLRIVFVKTGGPLLPDTYTVTLRSATDRFRHANGLLLDGNRDGVPGGDFVTTFTVGATRLPVLSVPDVARAPGQNVNVPATDTGLPLRISDGTGVQTVSLDFVYDPTLLSITGAALAATMPVSALLNTDTSVPGRLRATVQLSDPLSSGPQDILLMTATVPASAPYRAAGVLRIENVSINGTVGGVLTDDAVQVVALLGDTTGDGRYSSLDGQRVLRVAAGLDTGFAGYPLIDPVIIGDVTGDGRISSLDATRILQKVSGLPVPQIP